MATSVNDIIAELDDHGFEDLSNSRKLAFINDTHWEVCSLPYPFLERSEALTITGGTDTVTFSPPTGTTVDKIIAFVETTDGTVLRPERLDTLTKNYAYNLTQSGRPYIYYFIGSTVKVYPVADTSRTYTVRYTVIPTALGISDNLLVPDPHARLVTLGALVKSYMMNDDSDIAQFFQKEYDRRLRMAQEQLWRQHYDRPDYVIDVGDDGGGFINYYS